MISKITNLIGGSTATATVTPELYENEVLDARIAEAERTKPSVSPRAEKSAKSNSMSKVHGDKKEKKNEGVDGDVASEVSESEDLEPIEVLLQFIPYYGQGDPANDSLVRSTLSSLSVEDIDAKDEYGNTLLLLACQYRCEDLVRIMLNKGANPNAVNLSGACCLHFACYRESASYNIAKILLQNGANPDIAETSFGCTPLHYCAGNGDIEFCKLILSYGAQINAYDYYNYTCVDYAREAGFEEAAEFLRQRLEKFNSQNQLRGGFGSTRNMKAKAPVSQSSYDDINEWESHLDPDSGGKYYINLKSGECLWESELKQKLISSQFHSFGRTSSMRTGPAATETQNDAILGEKEKAKLAQISLISQAAQATLVIFFTKYDPSRLVEVESLMQRYKGNELDLASQLKERYKPLDDDHEFSAFFNKGKELKKLYVQGTSDEIVSDVNRIDPFVIQELVQEARKKFELQLEEETLGLKKKFDLQLEEERTSYRFTISEKEGTIAKLQTELDSLSRDKQYVNGEIEEMRIRLNSVQSSGGEELQKLEKELGLLKDENSDLKRQISSLNEQLNYEKDKLKSLELTLQNLTAGKEELIAREKSAAEERAQQQRLKEEQFNAQLRDFEAKSKEKELKLKSELNQSKNDWLRREQDLNNTLDGIKKTKDREIESLRKELADRKAQFAQEISSALMQAEDFKKMSEEAQRRAEEAEHFQKLVQAELAEAKVVQKYNAQLHKDLLREQLTRKKLHNDMEDLKGKIRVYVRIRPMSQSERERGSQEAVFKDGKMTVMLKGIGGPEGKKFYDFDQVFAGSDGNTQMDVFKDTKHLMMSVIDGYNVCIFAYGQTGAGKSYTMIGSADIGSCMTENGEFDEQAGITPRAVSELFRLLNERTAQVEYVVDVQMFQLYRDNIDDLLKEKKRKKKDDDDKADPPLKITLAEHSPTGLVFIDGAETITATNPGEVMKIFARGSARRTTASTQMNAESSRSHLICSLVVKLTNRRSGTQTVGKLTLVDLAGSERVDKSGATGEQLKEAQSINKSLSALGDVIAALTTNQQHVPYRNHPLTMLMSDSIGGNAKTLMFVNTSPADYNLQESNNSLAFANRCKDITNMVAVGPGVQAAQMTALKKELAKLKKGGGGVPARGGAQMLERPDTAAAGGRSKV